MFLSALCLHAVLWLGRAGLGRRWRSCGADGGLGGSRCLGGNSGRSWGLRWSHRWRWCRSHRRSHSRRRGQNTGLEATVRVVVNVVVAWVHLASALFVGLWGRSWRWGSSWSFDWRLGRGLGRSLGRCLGWGSRGHLWAWSWSRRWSLGLRWGVARAESQLEVRRERARVGLGVVLRIQVRVRAPVRETRELAAVGAVRVGLRRDLHRDVEALARLGVLLALVKAAAVLELRKESKGDKIVSIRHTYSEYSKDSSTHPWVETRRDDADVVPGERQVALGRKLHHCTRNKILSASNSQ